MTKTIILLSVITLIFTISIISVPSAFATSNTLDAAFCATMGGVWTAPPDTCTINTPGYTIPFGDELIVPFGTNLVISNISEIGIRVEGLITNNGMITISNSGNTQTTSLGLLIGNSFSNVGALTNSESGTILIQNTAGQGISNRFGTITNNGTITIETSNQSGGIINNNAFFNNGIITIFSQGGGGIVSSFVESTYSGARFINSATGNISISGTSGSGISVRDSNFTNDGTITITSFSSITGISFGIQASLTNNGVITLSNTAGIGITNSDGGITNNGTIIIENSDGHGIFNRENAVINSETGNIAIKNTGGIGIENDEELANHGEIIISNTGGTGILNTRTFTSSATGFISIENPGGDGVFNDGILANNGDISICGGTYVEGDSGSIIGNPDFLICLEDTTPPVIFVPSAITESATSTHFTDGGTAVSFSVSAVDNVDGSITPICDYTSGDFFPVGTITVSCNATDAALNPNSESFDVIIGDDTPPVITLLGNPFVGIIQGETYLDEEATALDNVDGDITVDIIIVNPVDENTPDTYFVTYNVSDGVGNPAVQITRIVIVISGTSSITCGGGTTLNTATNECEADVTQDDLDLLQNIINNLNAIIMQLQSIITGQSDAEICHKPETNQETTMQVSVQQLQGHLNHGDTFGECVE